MKAFDSPDAVQASGIRAAGDKYFTLVAGERSVYGKKQVCRLLLVDERDVDCNVG